VVAMAAVILAMKVMETETERRATRRPPRPKSQDQTANLRYQCLGIGRYGPWKLGTGMLLSDLLSSIVGAGAGAVDVDMV